MDLFYEKNKSFYLKKARAWKKVFKSYTHTHKNICFQKYFLKSLQKSLVLYKRDILFPLKKMFKNLSKIVYQKDVFILRWLPKGNVKWKHNNWIGEIAFKNMTQIEQHGQGKLEYNW